MHSDPFATIGTVHAVWDAEKNKRLNQRWCVRKPEKYSADGVQEYFLFWKYRRQTDKKKICGL